MKAVILAAGEGKRLRPFTETLPKVMLPVSNKPILEYVFDAVRNSGIDEIIVVVGYKKEVIMNYFKDYTGINIRYVTQDKQLGTAHALLQAKSYVKDSFIVLSGDNIIDEKSISKLIYDKSEYSILIKEFSQSSKYGVVLIEKGKLKNIIEKPKEDLGKFISTGIYKLPTLVFNDIDEKTSQGIYDLSSIIEFIISKGNIINTIVTDSWVDVVYPWDLIYLNESLIHKASPVTSGKIDKGVTIKGNVSIGKDTNIYSGCYIVGPVIIGEGCELGPNTCIFPSTTIGNNTVIHPFSQIRNSVIMKDVRVGSNCFIKNSIIGQGSIIDNNFSTREGMATIEIEGEYNKLKNIGAIIGEDCDIGSNVVVDPGIIIGRKCDIKPLKRISNNISSNSIVM